MGDPLILLIFGGVVLLILLVVMKDDKREGYQISQDRYNKCQQEYEECYRSGQVPGYVCADKADACFNKRV